MSLLTEENSYNAEKAFALLSRFHHGTTKNAIASLTENQTICKKTATTDRQLPGRGMRISEKFLSLIKGSLPERLFTQAGKFAKKLSDSTATGIEIPTTINCGGIAAILDFAASHRITLYSNPGLFSLTTRFLYHRVFPCLL